MKPWFVMLILIVACARPLPPQEMPAKEPVGAIPPLPSAAAPRIPEPAVEVVLQLNESPQAEQNTTTVPSVEQGTPENSSNAAVPLSVNFSIAGMHLDWSQNQSKGFMRSLSIRVNNPGIALPDGRLALEVVVRPSDTEDMPSVRYRLPEIPAYRESLIKLQTQYTEMRESARYDRDVKYAEKGLQYDIQRATFGLLDLSSMQQVANISMNITLIRDYGVNPHDSYLSFFRFSTQPKLSLPSLAYNDSGLQLERTSNEQNISVFVQSLSSAAFPQLIFDLYCEEADAKRNFYADVHRLNGFASGAAVNITLAKPQSCAKPTILARESLEPKFSAKSSDLITAR
ncbi:hypothetical protein HY642_01325 [Candidatus Woesearchaeota archaeon]|nr:hypothetical protein [Candidatus Woesearchaeota archaeon]